MLGKHVWRLLGVRCRNACNSLRRWADLALRGWLVADESLAGPDAFMGLQLAWLSVSIPSHFGDCSLCLLLETSCECSASLNVNFVTTYFSGNAYFAQNDYERAFLNGPEPVLAHDAGVSAREKLSSRQSPENECHAVCVAGPGYRHR